MELITNEKDLKNYYTISEIDNLFDVNAKTIQVYASRGQVFEDGDVAKIKWGDKRYLLLFKKGAIESRWKKKKHLEN